jgi:hypothetical protein
MKSRPEGGRISGTVSPHQHEQKPVVSVVEEYIL